MSAPCVKCGVDTEHVVELTGMIIAGRPMCGGCFSESLVDLDKLGRQFQFLINNGVSRKRANELIIKRIEAMR